MDKSRIAKVMVAFSFALLMVGCGYTKEEKQLMATYEKNAKTNAVNYVEAKYGFTPKVVGTTVLKVDSGPVPDFTPAPSGRVNVSMKNGDHEFTVNISGEELNTDGKDDYQKFEIADAFKDRLSKELAINIADIDIRYTDDSCIEPYFTDVDSFLVDVGSQNIISIIVKTLDDISESTVQNAIYDRVELLVVSCHTQADLDVMSRFEYLEDHAYRHNFYRVDYLNNKMMEYALYMKGHVFRNMEGEVSCKLYERKQVDDLYYVYDKQLASGEVKVSETSDMSPAEDWSKASGKVKTLPTFINPYQVSKSYEVDFGGLPSLQIFMAKDNQSGDDKAERYAALEYIDNDGQKVYTHIGLHKVEDYYSFTLDNYDDMKFALMINKD